MKKKLFSLMSLLMAGVMAWASVPAADGGSADPSLIMGVYLSDPGNAPRRMTVTVTGENEYKIETTSTDSWTPLTALTSDWTSDLTAVTFEYKLNVKTDCEFFFGQPFGSYAGGKEQQFILEAANDWTVCYVDIASWREKFGWGKKGDNLRLDVGDGAGIVLSIRNIQPATTEAYQAYLDEKSGLKPVDGWYMLGSAQDLAKFAKIVNDGANTANAKLTADIDLSEIADWTSICVNAAGYAGVFDGQNHTITNFKKVAKTNAGGLFGYVVNGTVKNLTVYGDLTCTGTWGGLIASGSGATVENVHSYLNIKCTPSNTLHVGGVLGSARDNSVISNCSFHGTLEVGAGNTDCFGGISGYSNTGKFVNCANYGELTCVESACYLGGILGYLNNAGNPGIQNCYGGGSVKRTTGVGQYTSALVGRLNGHNAATILNNYWNENSATQGSGQNAHANIKKVSNDQVLSGEVCFALNGGQNATAWYQEIGVDAYPVLNNTKPSVKYVGAAGVATMSSTEAFELNGDVKASIITGANSNNKLIQKDVTVVPANTAVVLEGTYYNVMPATSAADDCTGNMLVAVAADMEAPVGSYVLQKNNDVVGFYCVEAGAQPTIKAGKAYLSVPSAEVKAFFLGDNATGIDLTTDNGQQTTAIYNLSGQRIQKMQKGINIVDGKKILK